MPKPAAELFAVRDIQQRGKKLTYKKHPLKFPKGVEPTVKHFEETKISQRTIAKLHMLGHYEIEEIAGEPITVENKPR